MIHATWYYIGTGNVNILTINHHRFTKGSTTANTVSVMASVYRALQTFAYAYLHFHLCNSMTVWYMLWPCHCACLSQVRVLSKWLNGSSWFLEQRLSAAYPTWCCMGIRASPFSKHKDTCLWNFVPNFELSRFICYFCHGTSIITSVVNLVWPTTIDSWSHSASTIVYNRMGMTHSVAWFMCDL